MSLLLLLKITITFLICMITGVFLGNSIWDYNIKIMPTWFKCTLGLVAISFFVSMFITIMTAIWIL